MYIESIHLKDWKGYVDETYRFHRPTKNKNVVLVGAENGYGKTSLLEALMLCLYGRDGLAHIPRATVVDGDQSKLDLSYDEFIRRAFHGYALESGRNSASVTVTLNDDGLQTAITRQWYFAGNGRHRAADEEVRIFQNGEPFKVGRFDDKGDAIRNFIARTFVPVYLAPFFLFDGEQVQRLAAKEMAAQVRIGIEGLLGVGTLRELQGDLRSYALSRRAGTTQSGSETVDELQTEIRKLADEIKRADSELQQIEPSLPGIRQARESKVKQLHAAAGGNQATIKEHYDQRAKADALRMQLRERLLEFMHTDLALALAGKALRDAAANRLRAEESREAWETGKEQGKPKLKVLQKALLAAAPTSNPPLTEQQIQWLQSELQAAWESLWFPPPSDVAESFLHLSLLGRDRRAVMNCLERVDSIAIGDIQNLLYELADAEAEIQRAESRIRDLSGIAEHAQKLTNEIEALTHQEQEIAARVRELKRILDGLRAQQNSKNADLQRVNEQLGRSLPSLQRAERADAISSIIDSMVQDMYPLKVDEVARAMTRIYKRLAHKTLVDHVEINDECEVLLLDRRGNDIRRFDASAGENQIFAVALISAIAEVSGAEVPIVVDTPLARLDRRHRMNVLAHLAEHPGQVILLSATDEVTGEYLDEIQSRVGTSYNLEFEELDAGIGLTSIREGYWGGKR